MTVKARKTAINPKVKPKIKVTRRITKEAVHKKTEVQELNSDLCKDLVENTKDLIHIIIPNGRLLYANNAWLKSLGYTRSKLKRLFLKDIIHPDSRKDCKGILQKLLSGKNIDNFETELITKEGKKLVVEVSAHVKSVNGKPAYIECILHDITDKRRIEEALQESEQKYMDLYQNAPVGYHSLGPDGMFLECNDTWLKMFGYQREELVGQLKITDLMNDEGLKVFKETFPRLKREGSIENIEYQLRKKDGSFLPILLSASAIYTKNGMFLKTRSIIRDISARIGYRTMLEQALEEWRKTFDSMPYSVLMIDKEFNIKRANKYFSSLYDIQIEELLGRRCFEIINSEELRGNCAQFVSNHSINVDICEYFDEKTSKYFMLYLTPVPDVFGLTKSFVIALVDITEIKDKEKKLTDSKNAFFNMLKELDFSYKELKGLYEGLIHSFVNAIDAKSPWTKGHSERVTNYSLSIAKEMGLDEEEIEMLKIASLLHDIGKIGTYDVILNKPNQLSREETNLINNHPARGVEILKPISQLQHILPIIRHHHERLDGKGYPDGLKGEAIPMLARIICIADAFDSMTSDRPYRPAGVKDFAIKELRTCSGTQFDHQAVAAFLRILEKS